MHVLATAGHVDHGKSALITALTGAQPDRLAEERRRGLSISLGYAWTHLPRAGEVAFVDVPGHERFISTTLAGLGPVGAALFVVAADDPWMPQAAEHLAALDALQVRHGVLVITRCDLADPARARADAQEKLSATSLHDVPSVAVSAHTGAGITELRDVLDEVLGAVPQPPAEAPVRLWVDRSFTVAGVGEVVTGTLPAGRVSRGDELACGQRRYRVRGLQQLGEVAEEATGVARVALNVVGEPSLEPGDVLTTPGAWHNTEVIDVRLEPAGDHADQRPPQRPIMHIASASLAVHQRWLGEGLARLTLPTPLPLRIGDRALLRDPGTRSMWGLLVLDPAPPPLRRRGAARTRAKQLATVSVPPTLVEEVARRGIVTKELLARIGIEVPDGEPPAGVVTADGWLMSAERAEQAGAAAKTVVEEQEKRDPMAQGLTLAALAEHLGLPSQKLAAALIHPPLRLVAGRIRSGGNELPEPVRRAVAALGVELSDSPFAAPGADELENLGLSADVQRAATRAGLLLRLGPGVVLLAGAEEEAARRLGELDQPFTVSEARKHLGSSRRVVLPLLAHLDHTGRTRRLPDDRRQVTGR